MECLQSVPYRGARLFPVWQAGVAGARTGGVLCGRRVLLQGRKGVSGECVLNVEGARRPVTGSQRLNKRLVRTRLRIKSSASAVSTLSLQRPVREDACRKRTKSVPTGTSHTRVWCFGCSNERERVVRGRGNPSTCGLGDPATELGGALSFCQRRCRMALVRHRCSVSLLDLTVDATCPQRSHPLGLLSTE